MIGYNRQDCKENFNAQKTSSLFVRWFGDLPGIMNRHRSPPSDFEDFESFSKLSTHRVGEYE